MFLTISDGHTVSPDRMIPAHVGWWEWKPDAEVDTGPPREP